MLPAAFCETLTRGGSVFRDVSVLPIGPEGLAEPRLSDFCRRILQPGQSEAFL